MTRKDKGREIAESNGVTRLPDRAGYAVGDHRVDYDVTGCDCDDWTGSGLWCEHLFAVDCAEDACYVDNSLCEECNDND